MRTTQNPLKNSVPLPAPPLVSACVVTHLAQGDYHADRLEVVRLCLDTMLAGLKGTSYELLIWDNGSEPDFVEWLRNYNPAVFVESANVGPHNARRNLAEMARGSILAMFDDDLIAHPDWLEMQLEVLTAYPNVGIVSGSPYRPAFGWHDVLIPEGAQIKRGRLIPDQYIRDAAESIGQSYENMQAICAGIDDVLLDYKGVKAWAHGHHFQFIGRREVVTPFLFRSGLYLDNGKRFNESVREAGLLSLTTYRRSVLHCGNVVDPRTREIYKDWYGKDWK